MPSQRHSKARRVQRKREFQLAFDKGVRVKGRYLTLLMTPNQAGTARLGIVASRKLGNAVRRNRAKRLIREVFRRNVPMYDGGGVDVVAIPRRELFEATYSTLAEDFCSAFRRCASRISKHAR